MRAAGNIAGVVMLVLGAVWALQGYGILGGSFMTGRTQWLAIGLVLLVLGPVLLVWVNLLARGPGTRR